MYFSEHFRAIKIIFVNKSPSTMSSLAANCVNYFLNNHDGSAEKKQDMAWWKEIVFNFISFLL